MGDAQHLILQQVLCMRKIKASCISQLLLGHCYELALRPSPPVVSGLHEPHEPDDINSSLFELNVHLLKIVRRIKICYFLFLTSMSFLRRKWGILPNYLYKIQCWRQCYIPGRITDICQSICIREVASHSHEQLEVDW